MAVSEKSLAKDINLGGIVKSVGNGIKRVGGGIKNAVGGIKQGVSSFASQSSKSLKSFGSKFKARFIEAMRDNRGCVDTRELGKLFKGGSKTKEFGNDFNEILKFANKSINKDKVAIFKVTIPENVYNQLNHMNLDPSIFKSATPVVEPEILDLFNTSIINVEHF